MKLGIYTDAHFSLTSSIYSRIRGHKYSSRLDMLVESFKWMYKTFEDHGVDIIINAGDLISSDILKPEENSAIYEAFSYRGNIPEYHILGNHEIKDKNKEHHSMSLLRGYDNIEILDEMKVLEFEDESIILMPFTSSEDSYNELYELLENSDKSKKQYLFTHASYIGESYNRYIEMNGLDKLKLVTSYSNLKAIFNGHIHNIKDEEIYHQIGSLTGNSFSDNYDEGYPGVVIYDTKTDKLERVVNPKSVLFFKIKADTVRSIYNQIAKMPRDQPKCLRVDVPYSIKDNASEYLIKNSDKYNISEFRIKSLREVNESATPLEIESFSTYKNPHDALVGFIDSQESLPYPKEKMIGFLDKYVNN